MIRTEDKSLVAKGWIERLTAKRSEGKLFFHDGALLNLDGDVGYTIYAFVKTHRTRH